MSNTELAGHGHLEEWRRQCAERPLTREGKPFEVRTLVVYLTSREFQMPEECLRPNQNNVMCIDDGIMTDDYRQRIIPISGAGDGESIKTIYEVMSGIQIDGVKSHEHCGKVALVLGKKFEEMGFSHAPTKTQIDWEARRSAKNLVESLSHCVRHGEGRMIMFDHSVTRLDRPTFFHPADGAIVGLSCDFLHNLIPSERETPVQFRLAGHYYDNPKLHGFAVSEALLANKIASSDHGVGVFDRGFRLTAIVNSNDPRRGDLVSGAKQVEELLKLEIVRLQDKGEGINGVHLDILKYTSESLGGVCTTRFSKV